MKNKPSAINTYF